MKLFVANPRGFCAGVVRAIETVEKALELFGPPIYVKHQIVHNRHVVEDLEKKGAVFVEEIDEIPDKARVIYSAHGISPAVREQAKKKHLREIDASCGLVIRVHSAAKRFAKKGYQILLVGHRNHVEIIGTAGVAPKQTTIIESLEDVNQLNFSLDQKLFYITQTTLSLDDVREITEALQAKYPHIETLPTSSICYATTNRQLALREMIPSLDLILVVGDPTSSNSNRLCEVVHRRNKTAYLINDPEEINLNWLKGVDAIGLTAGASTPERIVQKCISFLKCHGVSKIEEIEYTIENVFFELPKEVIVPS